MSNSIILGVALCESDKVRHEMSELSDLERTVTQAFVALRDPVYRYVLAAVGNAEEAEDLTQEAFIRFFRDLRKGNAVENVRAWLFRVAHNLVIDSVRRAPSPDSLDAPENQRLADVVSDPEPNALDRIIDQAGRQKLLRRLSLQERRCLELRAEGLRYREIAEVLNLRIPSVQTTLGRAINKIVREIHG